MSGLKQQAINYRSGLEIDGAKDALEQAQKWLETESAKIEKKYA